MAREDTSHGVSKTPGDFVISFAYSGVGATANLYLYVWELQSSGSYGFVAKDLSIIALSGAKFAATNTTPVPVLYKAFDSKTNQAYFIQATTVAEPSAKFGILAGSLKK